MIKVKKTNTGENDILLEVRQGEIPCVEVRKFRAFGGTVQKLTVNCPSFRTDDLDELKWHIEVLQRAHEEARKLSAE
jgi:hypothetical protein